MNEANFDSASGSHQNYKPALHLRKGSLPAANSRSLLRFHGQNILNTVDPKARYSQMPEKSIEIKSNFLRKGQGIGGSPTLYDIGYQDHSTGQQFTRDQSQSLLGSPSKKSGTFFPVLRANNESTATVRTRTKGSSFIFSKKSLHERSPRDPSLEDLRSAQKEILNEKIQEYRQTKLRKQIEKMQAEQHEIEETIEREKVRDRKRGKRNEKLKKDLASYSEVKMKKE